MVCSLQLETFVCEEGFPQKLLLQNCLAKLLVGACAIFCHLRKDDSQAAHRLELLQAGHVLVNAVRVTTTSHCNVFLFPVTVVAHRLDFTYELLDSLVEESVQFLPRHQLNITKSVNTGAAIWILAGSHSCYGRCAETISAFPA